MKKLIIILLVIGVVAVGEYYFLSASEESSKPAPLNNLPSAMLLTSPSFKNNESIPQKFTCEGAPPGGANPELRIQNVPPEAKSLALIVDDPDATGGKTFTHWLIWNIDPKTAVIGEASKPEGSVGGMNGAGKTGYIGPCPPKGSKPHRYFFKLYALGSMLNLTEGSDKAALESEINKYLVAQTELVGLFGRQ